MRARYCYPDSVLPGLAYLRVIGDIVQISDIGGKLVEVAAWVGVSAIMMSFIEHQVHRRFMHRKSPLGNVIPAIHKVFDHHAIKHHGTYSKIFHDEPVAPGTDRGIRLNLREGFIESLPFAAIIAFFSIPGAIIFPCVAVGHHYLWNLIHIEMHKPEKRFFYNWPIYKFLARHHFLHHVYPEKNFNVVLPLADFVLGTAATPKRKDLKNMSRQGLGKRPFVAVEERELVHH